MHGGCGAAAVLVCEDITVSSLVHPITTPLPTTLVSVVMHSGSRGRCPVAWDECPNSRSPLNQSILRGSNANRSAFAAAHSGSSCRRGSGRAGGALVKSGHDLRLQKSPLPIQHLPASADTAVPCGSNRR